MRCRVAVSVILLLVVGVLCAPPLLAQEQRGAIEGVVKDSSGAVLPGVTVEAKNVNVGSTVTAVTDSNGAYRFPALAPGKYDVSANISGFATRKFEAVEILLGQIKKVDFALAVAGVTETVQVSAESPLVDVRQSARASSIRAEQLDLLPKGRDFMSVVTLAPGANDEAKSGGVMIDGATTGENRYIVDGAETSNIVSGGSGKSLIADFIEEVQVKSSGYTAEYGGATGGVINVVTKSGTNVWRGNLLFNMESDKLRASTITGTTNPKYLRLNPKDGTKAEYITYPADDYLRTEPGASIGGPVMKDNAWFFVAYQPTQVKFTRTVKAASDGTTITKERKQPQQYISANNTLQLGSKLRTRVAYNNSWSKNDGALPALDGSDPTTTNYAYGNKYPNYSVSAQADYVATPKVFFGARMGYYKSDQNDFGIPTDIRYRFTNTTNIGYLDVPTSLQRVTGFSSVPTNSSVTRDVQKRLAFQVDGTVYGNFGGQHTIKAGVQVDRLANDVLSGEQANYVQVFWNRDFSGTRGKYGYYRVRSNGPYPRMGFVTEGNVSTNNYGVFIQDAWTISNKLTINMGIRTENEKVPAYAAGEGIPTYGVQFSFKDKFAPRLGFAYDVKGDGRWKAYGSWGIFYDIFKMNLPRGSFGGEKWLEYYYTLDTYDWTTLAASASCPPACAGTKIRGPVDMRHPSFGSDAIDPNLKPMKSQEASFGIEHQLSPVSAVSVRFVRKWLNRAVDDTGSLDAQFNEIYVTANPGFGMTATAGQDLNGNAVPLPKARRDYNALELAFNKNMARNWSFRASYMWSKLFGNYSGLDQTDENGRQSPNTGRLYDYPIMSFDQNGNDLEGVLATDRTHQIKINAIYQMPWGTAIGVFQNISSGVPRTREMPVGPASSAYPMFYAGRGSDGRMPTYYQTNLYVQHEFKLGGRKALQASINVMNLFNQKIATNYFATILAGGYALADPYDDQAAFYSHKITNFDARAASMPKDPRFMMSSGFQTPLQARVGVKFLF